MTARTINDQVNRYADVWNEPDPHRRREELETLYTESACLLTRNSVSTGFEPVVAHIAAVYDEYIGPGRYRFQCGGVVAHHNCVLFRWEMVDAASRELADAGMATFLFSPDGRIEADYQFATGVDSSIGSHAGSPS